MFSVSYKEQAPGCGSKENFAKECCEGKECFRCGSKEHEVKDCNGKIKCDACKEFGHSFSKCPHSYASKVSVTIDWVQFDYDTSGEESFRAAVYRIEYKKKTKTLISDTATPMPMPMIMWLSGGAIL